MASQRNGHFSPLTFPTHGIRDVNTAKFQLRNLSEGGATICVGGITSVPDFFYLQFGDENSDLIGCYVVERNTLQIQHGNPVRSRR